MNVSRLVRKMEVVFASAGLLNVLASGGFAQSSTSNSFPVVTIVATQPHATWTGTPGVFTIYRYGNPTPALNVYCCIGGTASNGVDYQSISHFVTLASGVMSNTVVINPINNGQTNIETVVLDLCPSPYLTPVNYSIGYPSEATVYITPPGTSNLPPVVAMISPTNGEVYHAPVDIPLLAHASDPDGNVTNVEFFAGTNDLGRGLMLVLDPPGMNGWVGLVYYLDWMNVPTNTYTLTAVATDNGGASTVSGAVIITVLGQGSNQPPVVSMVYPTNGATFQAPTNIPLYAQASDPDGSVSNVEFFAGTNDLGSGQVVSADPRGTIYYLTWSNVPPKTYSLTAVATDNGGASTVSAPVNITVLGPVSNLPPVVRIISPPNGAVFHAPVNIPIFAYAADFEGSVTTVQFFADGGSLGFGHRVIVPTPLTPQPYPIFYPSNYWELLWINPFVGTNIALTAEATDDGGISMTSPPVEISVLPSPPPSTNRPPFVGIVASDPVAIEGTNCYPWLTLAGTPTWGNWTSPSAVFQWRTNCGPKDASFTVFRIGATNDDLNVTYAIGGSATNGVDYVTLPGDVLIPAGERTAMITVMPIDDGPPDITSTVVLKITPGTNYLVGFPPAAAAIILDGRHPRPVTGIVPGNLFHLCSTGPDGAWFHVDYSTDLINWTPLCTNQVVNGNIDFVDPEAATNPSRFYRAVPELSAPMQ